MVGTAECMESCAVTDNPPALARWDNDRLAISVVAALWHEPRPLDEIFGHIRLRNEGEGRSVNPEKLQETIRHLEDGKRVRQSRGLYCLTPAGRSWMRSTPLWVPGNRYAAAAEAL
jgi:hypothetical protein